MKYKRQDYLNFLNTEFEKIKKDFDQLINTKALVLKSEGKVFTGPFLKIEGDMAIFKIRENENMPRKNSFWTAVYFSGDMAKFRCWGDYTWAYLCKNYQSDYSDAHCVWLSKADEPGMCLIGVNHISYEFAKLLQREKPLIAFGPQMPPMQYILNLRDIVADSRFDKVNSVLDYDEFNKDLWSPQNVSKESNLNELIRDSFSSSDGIAIQGPPGTGKTYRMAQLTAQLLKQDKSILVTALTNRALMELAEKDDLQPYVAKGKVLKTSLTVDESVELPGLLPVDDNSCFSANGYLTLASFYISSGWAVNAEEVPFDYVLMDEASQALLPMIAATFKLGRKIIWIGDQKQLPPIIKTNNDIISRFKWNDIISGFNTLCSNFNNPSYFLNDTFRLTKRAAEFTSLFYNSNLKSVSKEQKVPIQMQQIDNEGGPSLVNAKLGVGEKTSAIINNTALDIVGEILLKAPDAKIAVLSKFIDTIKGLQKHFTLNLKGYEKNKNLLVETVDSVQGLTVDYCIYIIPKASEQYSLDDNLFNVATSRAKYSTIIIADQEIMSYDMSERIRRYLLKIQKDKFISFNEKKTLSSGSISLSVVGKLDPSKFERKRKELVSGKENIYIIDTNVFVNCPDIINKIGHQYKTIVPSTVLEELDKLKLKESIDKKSLNEAAKNISRAFTNHFSKMEEGNVNLLPSGFDKTNPDCLILSVALKYKEENPILLSSDNILLTRAKGLGITTITLRDFLGK